MNFEILSLSEERQLSPLQLDNYYEDFRRYAQGRTLTNTTKGATTLAPKLKKFTNRIAFSLTKMLCAPHAVFLSDGQENIPEGPVLFAHTHQGLLDNFAWIPTCPKHCVIFHSVKVIRMLILAQLNTGLILVNKDDKESRLNAKLDAIKILLDGHSIAFFPESAWNLSPNKLHLPMNYGFIDIARKANVPIIPVVSEYTFDSSAPKVPATKIHIRYGPPLHVDIYDDLEKTLETYSEIISTIRYELIEENGVFSRADIASHEYWNYLNSNLDKLKLAHIDIDVERRNLWGYQDDFYRFHHINDVPCDKNGDLRRSNEYIRMEQLMPYHGAKG